MEYTQILEEGNIDALKEIYDLLIDQLPCRWISQPTVGKVVISHIDSQENTQKRISDVVATYCEVEVDDCIGYACIQGNNPERAKYVAVIDAIVWNSHWMEKLIDPFLEVVKNDLYRKYNKQSKELYV